jgi:hypothetical protein
MEELKLLKQGRLIQTPPLPSMLHAQMLLPDQAGMFRLGEALEFPAELVRAAGVAKPAFSALSRLQPIQISRCGLRHILNSQLELKICQDVDSPLFASLHLSGS